VQVYLVVRSFEKREAYLYSSWYARVANKPYCDDVSATQTEWESHFTLACYEDDPSVSNQQVPPCRPNLPTSIDRIEAWTTPVTLTIEIDLMQEL